MHVCLRVSGAPPGRGSRGARRKPGDEVVPLFRTRNEDREPFIESLFVNRIASGIKAGTRVKQGQIIGYVGSTGRSTGPHLHYEILVAGRQVNPRGVNLPVGHALAGRDMKKFKATINDLENQYAALTGTRVKVAQRQVDKDKDVN